MPTDLPSRTIALARELGRRLRRFALRFVGERSESTRYHLSDWNSGVVPTAHVDLRWTREDPVGSKESLAWLGCQTHPELRIVGPDGLPVSDGNETLAVAGVSGEPASWTLDCREQVYAWAPSAIESAWMVAAAEDIAEVELFDSFLVSSGPALRLRRTTLADSLALTKVIGSPPEASPSVTPRRRHARGEYRAETRLPEVLSVGIRDVGRIRRVERSRDRPTVLVLAPFLARGGAEHTLFETLLVLRERFHFVIATLAPHHEQLGDRRRDFLEITPDVFPLGDLVHPDAMGGLLESLVVSRGVEVLYNANGSTVFYDLLPRLRHRFPGIVVLDHLYDHEIGYIERYRSVPAPQVDVCIAENHQIALTLADRYGWPGEKTRVIWPCGRRAAEIPDRLAAESARVEIRSLLGVGEHEVLFLIAARLHPQKRPLDLVRLAERLGSHVPARFVWLGGGPLENEVRESARRAAARGARIQVLPFQSDVPRWIAAADVGCLVSGYEGLPVFFMECCQQGRPFLSTDVGDLGALLRSSAAGRVVPVGDLESLEAAARDLCDPEIRSEAARRAIALAPRFDVTACANLYAEAFQSGRRRE